MSVLCWCALSQSILTILFYYVFFSVIKCYNFNNYRFWNKKLYFTLNGNIFKVSKRAKIRNQNNQVPHLIQDITWESDKTTRKHHIQESQEVSPFQVDGHKTAMNRQESMTNTTLK